jgi:hypothetical protein
MSSPAPALALARVVAVLAAASSLAGLLWPGLYRDAEIVRAGWRANDVVTLLVAVPTLGIAGTRARAGSLAGQLVVIGALHYALYNFCFYLFGAALNPLLLVHAAIVGISLWALALALGELDLAALAGRFRDPPARRVAGWMALVSVGLATTWIAQWLIALARTSPPSRFDLTPEFVRVTAGLDLTLMVGLLAPGAILLWRGRPWGLVLATTTSVSGALYNLVLVGGTMAQIRAGLAGASALLALWLVLGAGCLACAGALLASLRRPV